MTTNDKTPNTLQSGRREADRVESEVPVFLSDGSCLMKSATTQVSANGVVLEGPFTPERVSGGVPFEISIHLPEGDVQAWAEPVRTVGDNVAFRLVGVTTQVRRALLGHVGMVEKRTATLH